MNPLNQAYQLFIDEVPELLQEIENGLLNLKQAKIDGMIRAAHSIKDSSASVGLKGIKDIAHQLEDYFKALYNEDLVIDTELENLFLEGYDCLAIPLTQQIDTGNFDRKESENRANKVWEKLELKLGNALKQVQNYLPSSEDLGIDIVASLFEVDVAGEIRRLKGVVASPESFEPEQELRESVDILIGLSELVNLSGFSLLTSITQQALQKHPDKAVTIATLLIQDLENSRELVAGGDRKEGGSPCSGLLTLAEDTSAQIELNVIEQLTQNYQITFNIEDPSYQFFLAEVPDLLHNLESGLLSVKEDKSISRVNDMMRSAHSLKGGAASVGLDGIKNISHQLEDYLKALFDESVIVDDELETYLLEGFDCLKNALNEQIDKGSYQIEWEKNASVIWDKLKQKLGHIQSNDYLPSSADLGIDMVQSLFEIDIAQIIEHLQNSLKNLPSVELPSEVILQLEILVGFSEMTDLKGLKDIAEAASLAINNYPQDIQEITALIIQDVTNARNLVLNGDRTQGGKPSQRLKELADIPTKESTLDFTQIAPQEQQNLSHQEINQEEETNQLREFADLMGDISSESEVYPENEAEPSEITEFGDLIPENANFDLREETDDFADLIGDMLNLNNDAPNSEFSYLTDKTDNFIPENEQENSYHDLNYLVDNFILEEDINQENESNSAQQKELQAQAYEFFMEEAVDLIAIIDNGLEGVLITRDINEINEIARAAHSLKGGARSAGLEDLGNIALRVEKSFKALFNENIPLDDNYQEYLREIYPLLRQPLMARMSGENFDEKSALDTINELWEMFEGKYGEEIAQSEQFLPSSADLGIDIATSIFEVDVTEGINTLQSTLDNGNPTELEDILSMQIEVFSGFGEMLVLPGFTAICETAANAFSLNPSNLNAITQAFINNLEIAKEQVLQGDRASGGEPSTELLALAGKTTQEKPPQVNIEQPIDTTDQAYHFFVEEAPELLEIIENGLLTLKEDRSIAKIHEIMRAAHSLKGGAASVGLEAIKTISHRLEDVFKVLYDVTIDLDTELESWILEGFDCLRNALTQQIETGNYNPESALVVADEVWKKIQTKLGVALSRADDYIPSSTDLGVDIVQSMFEVDVAEEIQRLKDVVNNPTNQPLAGELRATLEVFSGFGEMLVLPGFAEIAKLGLMAIENNPSRSLEIIKVIIQDAEKARNLVLAGNRSTGGEPSNELRRFATVQISYGELEEDNNHDLPFLTDVFSSLESNTDENNNNDLPFLTDVFSSLESNTDEIFTITSEDKETQTNTPSLDDVFNFNLDDDQIEAIHRGMKDDDNDEIPDIEDIFASEFSEEEINLLAKASELALEDDKHNTIPSINDVFAYNELPLDEEDNEDNTFIPSLSQVFSEVDLSLIDDIEEQQRDDDEQNNTFLPSLSQVFSSVDMSIFDKEDEEENEENEDNTALPSLSQVFSSVDMSIFDKEDEEENEENEDNTFLPSLSQVFSSVDMSIFDKEEKKETENLLPSNESLSQSMGINDATPSLEDVFSNSSENVEENNLTSSTFETTGLNPPETQNPNIIEDKIVSENEESFSTTLGMIDFGKETLMSIQEGINTPQFTTQENLNDIITSINVEYQNLPGLKSPEDVKSSFTKRVKKVSEKKPQIDPKVTTTTTSTKTNLSVRVDLDRLERMNNLIGELSINRNGLSLQNDKLQNSVKELLERFIRFQQMANNLRDLSDKMVASPDKFRSRNGNNSSPSISFQDSEFSLTSAFDSLEMDSYDNMYYVIEGLIEQMIQLEEAVDDIALFAGQSGQSVDTQRQMLNRLRDELMWARMLPLGEVLNRFPRVLRDLSVKYNKKVNLKLNGTSVLVDKAALEKLYDPLVHLIRNAFDHGIETPEIRKQRGKSETGIIEVKAYHQGNQTIIEIKDDGGGLNLNKIGQKALERKLLTPEQLAVTNKENLLELIFEPGFSTASSVTEISGRGVGLDIVRSQLRSLKGTISVDSEPGIGTTFIMGLPLTLTIDKLLILSSDAHFYALPSDNIEEIIVPEEDQLKTSGNKRFLHYEDKVIPIYPLIDLLEYRCYVAENSSVSQALEALPTPEEWLKPLLLMRLGQELFAIEVDNLVSEQELVIKPFGSALTAPSYTYGCTILGDGTLIPVINTTILLVNFFEASQPRTTVNRKAFSGGNGGTISETSLSNAFQIASVLVVDDSAAMRRTLALSLEKAGYRVIQAKDGKDALDQLQQNSQVSLVICDIEMPNMNGFEFLGQRRRYPELNKVPVAMLTSRSNDKHRKLATHLGANAYFTKPYIEQKFLQSIKSLIDQKSLVNA
ncbi:MAG: response regulator [Cyanobacteria bacterium]|nr:response regulator [Cyanobacteria bacterium CG_2015-16_32_12]